MSTVARMLVFEGRGDIEKRRLAEFLIAGLNTVI